MANVGSQIPVFQGAWSDQPYLRGDLVLRSGVLYQAVTDTAAQPGATSATPGKGNPASWANVTALVLDFTGSTDPTAGAGIPAAIGSTYHMAGSGLYVKTGSGATVWSNASGGGAVQQVTLLGPFHITFATADLVNGAGALITPIAAGGLVEAFMTSTHEWTGSSPGDEGFIFLATSTSDPSATLADYDIGNVAPPAAPAAWLTEDSALIGTDNGLASTLRNSLPRKVRAVSAVNVYAAVYTSGTITAGAADIYVTVMTPA